jgi:L-lactate dehydrogenase complex protein LldG
MSARDDILVSIRENRPQVTRPLPDVPLFDARQPASLLSAFKENLERMGGLLLDPPAAGDVLAPVRTKITGAKVVCSTVPEIAGNRDIGVGAPQELADVDFAIVRAASAVADTGSVLLGYSELHVNALTYLAQLLIVLLDSTDIVVNIHHAYGVRNSAPGTTRHSTPVPPPPQTSRAFS